MFSTKFNTSCLPPSSHLPPTFLPLPSHIAIQQELGKADRDYWAAYSSLFEDGQITYDGQGNPTGATGSKFRQGVSAANLDRLVKQQQERQDKLAEEFADPEAMKDFADSITNMLLDQLLALQTAVEQRITELEIQAETEQSATGAVTSKTNSDLATALAQLKQLKDQIKDIRREENKKSQFTRTWERNQSAIRQSAATLSDFADTMQDSEDESVQMAGKMIKSFTEIADSVFNVLDKITPLVDSTVQAMQATVEGASTAMVGTAAAGAEAIKTVEKASVILAVIGLALQIIQKIVDLVKSSADKESAERFENWQEAMEACEKSIKDLDDLANHLFGASRVNNLEEQLRLSQKAAQDTQKELDLLEEKARKRRENKEFWNDFGKAFVYAGGAGLFSKPLMDELKKKKQELEESTDYDNLKKKDKERYDAYMEQLEEEIERQQELQEAIEETIFGESIESAIERFGEAYAEAWESGKTTAETTADFIRDTYKGIMQGIINDTIQTSGKIEEARKLAYLAIQKELGMTSEAYEKTRRGARFKTQEGIAAYEQSGLKEFGITYDEFFSLSAEELMKRVEDNIEAAGADLDNIHRIFDKLGLTENQRDASAQGIATASQESVDELNGRMTAVQGHTFNLSENSNIMRETIDAIYGDVHLIERHTRELYDIRSSMRNIESNITRLVS